LLLATPKDNTFRPFLNKFYVESGSMTGRSIRLAKESGFEVVFSIELAEQFYKYCTERFAHDESIAVVHGDSGKILYDVIKDLDAPITFFLDGHYSGGKTAKGDECSPILKELNQIKKHPIKTHTTI